MEIPLERWHQLLILHHCGQKNLHYRWNFTVTFLGTLLQVDHGPVIHLFIYLKFIYFIYLFLAVLGLHFCARAFSSCSERGPLFIAVRGPLTVAASLVVEHKLQTRRLSSCGPWAQLLRGMWYLPRPGLEPVSPALAGRFSTTAPPGKPYPLIFNPDNDKFRITDLPPLMVGLHPDKRIIVSWKYHKSKIHVIYLTYIKHAQNTYISLQLDKII